MIKKYIAILVVMLTASYAAHALKIAVFDYQRVVMQSKMGQDIGDRLQKQFKPQQVAISDMQAEMSKKFEYLQSHQSVMQPANLEKLQNEIATLKIKADRASEDLQRDFQLAQNAHTREIMTRLELEVNKIAKDEKFDIVLRKEATAFVAPALDITDKLISALK